MENRDGAGGVLGTDIVAKAAPDGHALLIISPAHAINPAFYKLPYDQENVFIPVAQVGSGPNVLLVHPSVPANSVRELIALAKKQPRNLIYPSAGTGSYRQLLGELFIRMAGIEAKIIQFKGGGPATVDLLGGHSHFSFSPVTEGLGRARSGKLKMLGIGTLNRTANLPDVPTVAETVPGFEATTWWGLLATAGTPQAVVDRLNKELAVILSSAETKKFFEDQGADAELVGPAEFGKLVAAETAKWGRIIKEANIKVE